MILVTGASGLLGMAVVLRARELGYEVAGLFHKHSIQVGGVGCWSLDLADTQASETLIRRLRPTTIIHCAAATNVDWCEENPVLAEQLHVSASAHLARIAGELGSRLVYVSTDSVFDGGRGNYSENDATTPLNVYAASKLRGEQETLRNYSKALVTRVNIYGWNGQNKESLAEWILHRLERGEPVPGFTDVYFTPVLVQDLAEILFCMLERNLQGLYHVAGSERVSKYEFARRIARVFALNELLVTPSTLASAKLRAPRPADTSLSTSKVAQALSRTMPNLHEGLQRFRELRECGHPSELKAYATGASGV
jgi:dTDP-4-dehydrorhamnose reductase